MEKNVKWVHSASIISQSESRS